MYKRTITWMMPLAVLTGFALVSPAARVVEVPGDSEQVSSLLSDVNTTAFQLKQDASTMESFTRMDVSWDTHKEFINRIREHINTLGRQAAALQAAKNIASPWQKTAIVRITPFLDELGGYTSAVIEHLSGDRKHTPAEYKDYLEANSDYASDLCAMIGEFVDYGRTKQRVERLADKLEFGNR